MNWRFSYSFVLHKKTGVNNNKLCQSSYRTWRHQRNGSSADPMQIEDLIKSFKTVKMALPIAVVQVGNGYAC